MKKLLLLTALIISFSSFGQESYFNFDDIKGISSLKLFKKFSFEQGFTKVRDSDFQVTYALNYDSKEEAANIWAHYYKYSKSFSFQLVQEYDGSSNKSFETILNQVKKQCKFYDFKDRVGDEYACYTCPNSSYKGKIGFHRGDKSDYIEIFVD